MSEFQHKLKVLFFGRYGCNWSNQIAKKIADLDFDITIVMSRHRNERLPKSVSDWSGDYIICFRSLFVLPEQIINAANIAALNLHPGPPGYPGSACINFALYEHAEKYGVTLHEMTKKVDSGRIVEVREFPIKPEDDLQSLLSMTHKKMYEMCRDLLVGLHQVGSGYIESKKKLTGHLVWSGTRRKIAELDQLQKIPLDISCQELERIIRATSISGFRPTLNLHGHVFELAVED